MPTAEQYREERQYIPSDDNPEQPYTFAYALDNAIKQKVGVQDIEVSGKANLQYSRFQSIRMGVLIPNADVITRLGNAIGVVFFWMSGVGWYWDEYGSDSDEQQ